MRTNPLDSPYGAITYVPKGTEPITKEQLRLLRSRGISAVKVVKRGVLGDGYAVVFLGHEEHEHRSPGDFVTAGSFRVHGDNHQAQRAWFHTGIFGVGSMDASMATLLRNVKAGGYLLFEACLDSWSNGYVKAANLHADVLYAHTYDANGQWTGRYEVAHSICPDNTARPTYVWKDVVQPAEDTFLRKVTA